jgi:hypothetical protein
MSNYYEQGAPFPYEVKSEVVNDVQVTLVEDEENFIVLAETFNAEVGITEGTLNQMTLDTRGGAEMVYSLWLMRYQTN